MRISKSRGEMIFKVYECFMNDIYVLSGKEKKGRKILLSVSIPKVEVGPEKECI